MASDASRCSSLLSWHFILICLKNQYAILIYQGNQGIIPLAPGIHPADCFDSAALNYSLDVSPTNCIVRYSHIVYIFLLSLYSYSVWTGCGHYCGYCPHYCLHNVHFLSTLLSIFLSTLYSFYVLWRIERSITFRSMTDSPITKAFQWVPAFRYPVCTPLTKANVPYWQQVFNDTMNPIINMFFD